MHAVLSMCPSFLSIVDDNIHYSDHRVVQFSHYSVKEFLTSGRLAEANDIILRSYHISEIPAHTLATQACLGYLLPLDMDVTSDSLRNLPFIEYSAEYWVDHARPEDVSRVVKDGLEELFDPSKPHLAVYIWIGDSTFLHGHDGPNLIHSTSLQLLGKCGLDKNHSGGRCQPCKCITLRSSSSSTQGRPRTRRTPGRCFRFL